MSTHTPGPWESFKGSHRNGYLIITCPAECDNQIGRFRPFSRYELDGDANARLIAAAPELLKACKELHVWFGGMVDGLVDEECKTAVDNARTVIAKAEGA